MVALLALPIFTAYGIVYSGGPLFPFVALAAFVPFLVLPAVVGVIITLLLVNVFPARRTRELLGLLGAGRAGILVVMLLRFMRPEQLARPEGFKNLVDYLAALQHPDQPAAAQRVGGRHDHELAAAGGRSRIRSRCSGASGSSAVALGALVHHWLYPSGFSKAQEGAERKVRRPLRGPLGALLPELPAAKREFISRTCGCSSGTTPSGASSSCWPCC